MKINKRFQEYIDALNFRSALFGSREIKFPLTQGDVNELAARLSMDLSPENLSCDGELPRAKVRSRYNKLHGIYKDLGKYSEKHFLKVPELLY